MEYDDNEDELSMETKLGALKHLQRMNFLEPGDEEEIKRLEAEQSLPMSQEMTERLRKKKNEEQIRSLFPPVK